MRVLPLLALFVSAATNCTEEIVSTSSDFVSDYLSVAFGVFAPLETLPDSDFNNIHYGAAIMLDSWKDPQSAELVFQQLMSEIPAEDRENMMEMIHAGIYTIGWLHNRLQLSNVVVRRFHDKCVEVLKSRRFLKGSLHEKVNIGVEVWESFDFTEEEFNELELLEYELSEMFSSLDRQFNDHTEL